MLLHTYVPCACFFDGEQGTLRYAGARRDQAGSLSCFLTARRRLLLTTDKFLVRGILDAQREAKYMSTRARMPDSTGIFLPTVSAKSASENVRDKG